MTRSAILFALLAGLPAGPGTRAEGGGEPPAAGPAPPVERPEPPAEAPAVVPLPAAGVYSAADLFELVEAVSGRPVRPASGDLEEIPVKILAEIAGKDQTIADLLVLLGAHGIYLFPHRPAPDGKEGGEEEWIATRDRNWRPPQPLHTRIFTIRPRSFRRAVEELGKFLEEKNRVLPAGAAPTIALPVAATGRIIVRSGSRSTLEAVADFLRRLDRLPAAADAQSLHVYTARNLRAGDLHRKMLGFLTEAEARRLRVVLPRGTNALWIRAHPELWRKVRGALLVVDGLNGDPETEPGEPGNGQEATGPVEDERDAGSP